MTPTPHTDPLLEETPVELVELGRLIATLPDPQARVVDAKYQQVVEAFRRRRRILNLVQEALSQLRLDVKYLMFDLEMTRRERDDLRSQLEDTRTDDFGTW